MTQVDYENTKKMLEVLTPLLAGIAGAIAIRGKTWNDERNRPTRIGWIAAGVTIITVIVSISLWAVAKHIDDLKEQQQVAIRAKEEEFRKSVQNLLERQTTPLGDIEFSFLVRLVNGLNNPKQNGPDPLMPFLDTLRDQFQLLQRTMNGRQSPSDPPALDYYGVAHESGNVVRVAVRTKNFEQGLPHTARSLHMDVEIRSAKTPANATGADVSIPIDSNLVHEWTGGHALIYDAQKNAVLLRGEGVKTNRANWRTRRPVISTADVDMGDVRVALPHNGHELNALLLRTSTGAMFVAEHLNFETYMYPGEFGRWWRGRLKRVDGYAHQYIPQP